jgi:hypothetical protein
MVNLPSYLGRLRTQRVSPRIDVISIVETTTEFYRLRTSDSIPSNS